MNEKTPSAEKYSAEAQQRAVMRNIDEWAKKEGVKVTYVSGLIATRTNPETGEMEVLLVNGFSKDENGERTIRKPYWQFPGGKVKSDEDPRAALDREVEEELGVKPPESTKYVSTYLPEETIDRENGTALVIHTYAFPEDSSWTEDDLKPQDDVAEIIWTNDPFGFVMKQGMTLTPQTDFMLKVLGYHDPEHANTPKDESLTDEIPGHKTGDLTPRTITGKWHQARKRALEQEARERAKENE